MDTDGREVAAGQEGSCRCAAPRSCRNTCASPRRPRTSSPADGWLSSGDVAIIDEDGWIYLVDRLKDQINASGFKVWPREVEDALYEHPDVYEAAVVGAPDEYRGETVTAYVSLRPGSSTTAAALQEFTKERLAAYKYPDTSTSSTNCPRPRRGRSSAATCATQCERPPIMLRALTRPVVYLVERWLPGPLILAIILTIIAAIAALTMTDTTAGRTRHGLG